MIRVKVIQNYYERFGNFDKINNSYTGKLLDKSEDAYEFLGYATFTYRNHKYSAKDTHDLRMAYLKDDLEAANKIMKVSSLEDLGKILNKFKMLPDKKEEGDGLKIPESLKVYVNVLAEYYKNLDSYVIFKGTPMTLKDALAVFKFQPRAIKSNIKTLLEDNKKVLVNIEHGDKICAYGRKLYVTSGLSTKQINSLHFKAMLKAVQDSMQVPDKCIKNPLELFTLGLTDTKAYLNLLESAELNEMTLSQYLERMGFHVPNCEVMFKDLGILLAILGQNAVIINEDADGKSSINYTTELTAKQLCSKILNG